jgi:DNA-binding NarL/FixJ family response regulator
VLRVLLCDDTQELRALARWSLERCPDVEVVGEAGDGAAALRQAGELAPDVVVCDLDMPGVEAAGLLDGLHAAAPEASLVTFSGYEPELVAGEAAALVAAHVPKAAGLDVLCSGVLEVRSWAGS